MSNILRAWAASSALILLCLLGSCSKEQVAPATNLFAQISSNGTSDLDNIEAIKKWFANSSSKTNPISLDWSKANTVDNWVIVPFSEIFNPFEQSGKQGFRFLVVWAQKNGSYNGHIIELVLPTKAASVEQASNLVLAGVQSLMIKGSPSASLEFLTGCLFIYSPKYVYKDGLWYEKGILQQKRVKLQRRLTTKQQLADQQNISLRASTASNPSTNLTQVCEIIDVVVTDGNGNYLGGYTTTSCTVSSPGSGGGTPSGGGWGGTDGGGGGGSTSGPGSTSNNVLSPNTILVHAPASPGIPDVREYTKCFNQSQGARLTLYVDQPKPGTRSTWAGIITDPEVGHTFISITQGNITRVLGFYPSAGVSPLAPATSSILFNDSNHPYNVSIGKIITSSQLTNLLNYINNYSRIYDLNTYNCTNFGIGAAKSAGISLPSTEGSWGFGEGCNPGDLGEDIRDMPKSDGIRISTVKGSADSNIGGC